MYLRDAEWALKKELKKELDLEKKLEKYRKEMEEARRGEKVPRERWNPFRIFGL